MIRFRHWILTEAIVVTVGVALALYLFGLGPSIFYGLALLGVLKLIDVFKGDGST